MKTVSKKLLSFMLVAILLVSALPFQAFATNPHDDGHNTRPVQDGEYFHDIVCDDVNCMRYNDVLSDNESHIWNGSICTVCNYVHAIHTLDADGNCSVCDYKCPTHAWVDNPLVPAVGATCAAPGSTAGKICMTCGATKAPEPIAQLSHQYDSSHKCQLCGAPQPGTTITFRANPGTINGSETYTYFAFDGDIITDIPRPDARAEYNFLYWLGADGTKLYPNNTTSITYKSSMGTEFTAVWEAKTKHVEVYAVLNGNYGSPMSGYVWQGEAPENGDLLAYLTSNAAQSVKNALAMNPGYTWDEVFRDRMGNPLASGTANQGQNIYVNFTSIPYKLSFNADGGSVAPSSKIVYKGVKVGTLPTPVREGKVFMGWKDNNGKVYTENTVYEVAGDTNLTAEWKDQAKVYLRVYLNYNFSTPDRLLEVDQYVADDHISWSAIDAYLRKYYAPASGSSMVVNGLFDKSGWDGYRSNPYQERKTDIRVAANSGTEIYVMITGAAGVNTVPTNPTIPTNPTVPANGFWVRDLNGNLKWYNAGSSVPAGNGYWQYDANGNPTIWVMTTGNSGSSIPTNPTVPANGFWVRDLNGNLKWYPAGSSLPAGNGYWQYDSNGNPNIWVMTNGSTIPTYIIINGSNPKTGDTARIELAAAIMVLAAAALVTVMVLRKKKSV